MSGSNKSTPEALEPLPAGFVPGDHDVVIGKGKKFYFHTGNQWLRTLVASMLDEYKKAQTKSDKSNIISDVVEYVRQHGRFVKRDLKSGKWVYAEPLLCREKCSQTFRDNLAETYRSSNVAKRNKRRAEQQEKKNMPQVKRMRMEPAPVIAPTALPAVPAAPVMPPLNLQPQQQQQHQAPAPIPANLFDLDMPLWSPKQRSNSLLPSNLDFSALTRGSITGTAGSFDGGLNLGSFNAGANNTNANSTTSTTNVTNNTAACSSSSSSNSSSNNSNTLQALNSINLMQSLPDILSNLTQLVNNQNQQTTAPAPAPEQTIGNGALNISAFEPAPMGGGLPPLNGTIEPAPAAATLPTLDLGALFEPRPMAEKRHSLALISDFDWLKPNNNGNTNNADEQLNIFDPKISAAFAA